MVYAVKTNIIPLVESLVNAIQPFAEGNAVRLLFGCAQENIEISHHPESIIPDLTRLLCRIIALTPQDYEVRLQIPPIDPLKDKNMQVLVINSGVDLTNVRKGIIAGISWDISVRPLEEGTSFEWAIPLDEWEIRKQERPPIDVAHASKYLISPFYEKLKRHLSTHFTSIGNLEKVADARSQRDGVFLKKVNAVIMAHLDREAFDSITLAKALALSRTQLHRRLKSLIGFAPARYIRYVRLQKAKEFLEREDVTVGEAAFRTGFVNLSHFTRAFREQFGFNPSELRQGWRGNG